MEDELGPAAGEGACDLPGLRVSDVEVEDQVFAGDLTQRLGAADVEGVLIAELAVELGAAGDGLFEVEGVGNVEGGGAVGDAGGVNVVDPEVDVAVLVCLLASFFGRFGVEPDQRFFDEPVDLRPAAAVRERSQLPVDERRSLGGEEAGVVGDPQCLPHRHLTVQQACPESAGGGGRAR